MDDERPPSFPPAEWDHPDAVRCQLIACARCGWNHADIQFRPLTIPSDEWTHWAPCPGNGEPILMRIVREVPGGPTIAAGV